MKDLWNFFKIYLLIVVVVTIIFLIKKLIVTKKFEKKENKKLENKNLSIYELIRSSIRECGKLPEDFIEGMACIGGCVGGPSSHKDYMKAKKDIDLTV